MASIKEVVVALGGYPIQSVLKDFDNARNNRKRPRNIIRLTAGFIGIMVGLFIPLYIAPDFGVWLKSILWNALSLGSIPWVTALAITMWASGYLALIVVKYSCQLYCYYRFGDTNSDHILSLTESKRLSEIYALEENFEQDCHLQADIKKIFDFLVRKIRKAKQLEKDGTLNSALDTLHRENTKVEYKLILSEFRLGNIDPYENWVIINNMKKELTIEKLKQKIDLLCAAYQPFAIDAEASQLLDELEPECSRVLDEELSRQFDSSPNSARHRATLSVPSLSRLYSDRAGQKPSESLNAKASVLPPRHTSLEVPSPSHIELANTVITIEPEAKPIPELRRHRLHQHRRASRMSISLADSHHSQKKQAELIFKGWQKKQNKIIDTNTELKQVKKLIHFLKVRREELQANDHPSSIQGKHKQLHTDTPPLLNQNQLQLNAVFKA